MGESLRSQLFINSEKVGDFVDIKLPASGDEEEGDAEEESEEAVLHTGQSAVDGHQDQPGQNGGHRVFVRDLVEPDDFPDGIFP